jgi:hypothetical protein
MATATATKRRSIPAPEEVLGAQPYQLPTWLGAEPTGLDFIDGDLRERHIAACGVFAEAVEAEGLAVREQGAEGASHRAAVRAAVAVGSEPPVAPDPAVGEAKVSVAREDVGRAETALAEIAVEALATLRQRRVEVEPVLTHLSAALQHNLRAGPGGRIASRVEAVRAELATLESGPAIEIIPDTPAPTMTEETA